MRSERLLCFMLAVSTVGLGERIRNFMRPDLTALAVAAGPILKIRRKVEPPGVFLADHPATESL
jgi:hypothetical protein